MEGSLTCFLAFAVALWAGCDGYYDYQTAIPNGQHVPHPCKPNFIWHGVGHTNPGGGGNRNPFGVDFARLGHKWSVELCRLDSDGDGLTNGQELGDPSCVWTNGAIPASTDNITHPGVCDPWASEQCRQKNAWVSCDVGEFQCDAIHQPDVRNITLRIPRTKVPADETTYECFVFELPADQEYHVIATMPYIDNPNVMHHLGAIACDDNTPLMQSPAPCGSMGFPSCHAFIGLWTLGMAGDCVHPLAGFRIGKGSATRVMFQYHWTNKHHVDSWYDSSGMTLFYTPKLRPNDAGVLTVGQQFIHIPPGVASLTLEGGCSSSCTQRLVTSDMNVITVLNHMHYTGVGGNLQHSRDGRVIGNLSNQATYSYDSPLVFKFDPVVVVRPGDELKMVCRFSTLGRDVTTLWGPGSYEEMCYGIVTYFPKEAWRPEAGNCVQWKGVDLCDWTDGAPCDRARFLNASHPHTAAMIDDVLNHCDTDGECRVECPAVIARYRQSSVCLTGQLFEFLKYTAMTGSDAKLMKFVTALDICDVANNVTSLSTSRPAGTDSTQTQPSWSEGKPALAAFVELAKALGSRPLLQNIIFNN